MWYVLDLLLNMSCTDHLPYIFLSLTCFIGSRDNNANESHGSTPQGSTGVQCRTATEVKSCTPYLHYSNIPSSSESIITSLIALTIEYPKIQHLHSDSLNPLKNITHTLTKIVIDK